MIGTITNIGAVLLGGLIGLLIGNRLPERYTKIFFDAVGLFTLVLGISMAIKTGEPLLLVFSLILGALTGTAFNLQGKLDHFSELLKAKFHFSGSRFSEGLVVAFLLYCMGSLTVLGAIEEGTGNPPKLLYLKSIMDGFSSIALASTLGIGVLFSVIPLLIYQGGLTLIAFYSANGLPEVVVTELSATGGVLLVALGFNILGIKQFQVVNMLPTLIYIVVLVLMFS